MYKMSLYSDQNGTPGPWDLVILVFGFRQFFGEVLNTALINNHCQEPWKKKMEVNPCRSTPLYDGLMMYCRALLPALVSCLSAMLYSRVLLSCFSVLLY